MEKIDFTEWASPRSAMGCQKHIRLKTFIDHSAGNRAPNHHSDKLMPKRSHTPFQ
jgi:hypothetical protein